MFFNNNKNEYQPSLPYTNCVPINPEKKIIKYARNSNIRIRHYKKKLWIGLLVWFVCIVQLYFVFNLSDLCNAIIFYVQHYNTSILSAWVRWYIIYWILHILLLDHLISRYSVLLTPNTAAKFLWLGDKTAHKCLTKILINKN